MTVRAGRSLGCRAYTDEFTDALLDLERYSSEPKDGGVIAGIVEHTKPDRENNERDIKVEIKAKVLKLKDASKDEL